MANPALRPRHLAPGDKLGKFDLIRQIAVGGMAELYLARTMGIEGFEKLVVVKRILPQYAENPSFVNMFLNEARLSATLHHPNIGQIYDIGVEDRDYFFSMEYIHGEDLGRVLATAVENGVPISLDAALTLAAGLCAGLHYAHEKAGPDGKPLNVVHRDVSPSNVLVSYDGGVKLVDFGIARAGSQPSTTRGGLKGKIAYMSPEQCRGKGALDRRSDVFSVGTLLYELTTGQLPFTDETEYGVLSQIVNTDAAPPSKLVADYPPALEAIVMKALARDVDQRYPTALALQGDLEDFAHENRLRVSPLVVARLMSTLFPARLEEWDHARAQGAFFVEQHVVRTLIESGKAGDDGVVGGAPAALEPAAPPATDEDTTAVTALRAAAGPAADTSVTPPPIDLSLVDPAAPTSIGEAPSEPAPAPPPAPRASQPRLATPRPGTPPPRPGTPPPVAAEPGRIPTPPPGRIPTPPPGRLATPVPGMPGAVPIVHPAEMGALGAVSPPILGEPTPRPVAPVTELTERVRVAMPPPVADPTTFVRPARSRLPIYLAVVALLGAGAAITVVVLSGRTSVTGSSESAGPAAKQAPTSDEPATAAGTAPTPTEPVPAAPTEPAPAEAAAAAPAEPTPAAPTEPAPAADTTAEPATADRAAPAVARDVKPKPDPRSKPPAKPRSTRAVAVKKPVARPDIKAKADSKPDTKKEPAWNDDSPFMPVRPDKR